MIEIGCRDCMRRLEGHYDPARPVQRLEPSPHAIRKIDVGLYRFRRNALLAGEKPAESIRKGRRRSGGGKGFGARMARVLGRQELVQPLYSFPQHVFSRRQFIDTLRGHASPPQLDRLALYAQLCSFAGVSRKFPCWTTGTGTCIHLQVVSTSSCCQGWTAVEEGRGCALRGGRLGSRGRLWSRGIRLRRGYRQAETIMQ